MKDLSEHILDIVNNSVAAKASLIEITVDARRSEDRLSVTVKDDGCGMDEDFCSRATDPFVTTRSTRRVGLGLALFRQSALDADGRFELQSRLGQGTKVTAEYRLSHLDRLPLGDLADTVAFSVRDGVRLTLNYGVDEKKFVFDTDEAKQILGDFSLCSPEVMRFLAQYIKQGINSTNGGNEFI